MIEILPGRSMNTLLSKFGIKSRIYFSKLCTCVAENHGGYDPRCGVCIYGFVYDKGDKEETLLIKTAMNLRMMNERETNLYSGGANFTIPTVDMAGTPIQAHKRIMVGDVIVVDNDVRRDRDLCEIGFKDSLYAFDIREILSVSYKGKNFIEGKDYKVEIDPTGSKVIWLDGERPKQFYTVEFTSAVNYWVWDDTAKLRGSQFNTLPRLVKCRLRPYWEKKPLPIDEVPLHYDVINKPLEGELDGTEEN